MADSGDNEHDHVSMSTLSSGHDPFLTDPREKNNCVLCILTDKRYYLPKVRMLKVNSTFWTMLHVIPTFRI